MSPLGPRDSRDIPPGEPGFLLLVAWAWRNRYPVAGGAVLGGVVAAWSTAAGCGA